MGNSALSPMEYFLPPQSHSMPASADPSLIKAKSERLASRPMPVPLCQVFLEKEPATLLGL